MSAQYNLTFGPAIVEKLFIQSLKNGIFLAKMN